MKRLAVSFALLTILVSLMAPVSSALTDEEFQSRLESIDWVFGPDRGPMESIASITIPAGYVFATGRDVDTMMELTENPLTGREVGFVAPESLEWFAVFEFDESGYVRDDEKNDLDATAMLKAISEGTDSGNEERKRRGWSPLHVEGWETEPRYNEATHNLEWAIRLVSDGERSVNHNTRLLGRYGVMEVALVCAPDQLPTVLPEFQSLLADFAYDPGQRYAEFKEGDKVAKYGLAALVTGGAAAVAAKTGILAKLGKGFVKLIVFIGIALATLARKLFGRKEPA